MRFFVLFSAITLPVLFSSTLCAQSKKATADGIPVVNRYVLEAIKTMPKSGGYDASQAAVDRLAASVTVKDGVIRQDLNVAKASFCSGATYLVFLRTIEMLRHNGSLILSPEAVRRFAKMDVKDGEMVFGRWNANGPGGAKLFAELMCGENFTSFEDARPGDFMKIWWTQEIGGKERGHHVIYLGADKSSVRFWSSNLSDGYGIKTVERATIKRVIFSRLDRIDRLENVVKLSDKNVFLADMLGQSFSWGQVVKECKVTERISR